MKHLTPCDKYDTTATAKNIRAHLAHLIKTGVIEQTKFSVRKEHYDCINVSWTDGPSSKLIESELENFSNHGGTRMDDSVIYKNHDWNYGTVMYLHFRHDFSDNAMQVAIDKVNKEYNLNVTLEQYKNGEYPTLCSGADYWAYAKEVRRVLNGEVDYDLANARLTKAQAVKDVLNAKYGFYQGYKKEGSSVTVFCDDNVWGISASCVFHEDITDNDISPELMAQAINEVYDRLHAEYEQYLAIERAERQIRNRPITPIHERHTDKLITGKISTWNKLDWLSEVDEHLDDDTRLHVKKVVILSDEDYDHVANTLMNNRDFWEKIGGNYIDDQYLEGLTQGTDEYYQAWHDHGITNVIEVMNESMTDCFYVDCSGYDYARYAGRSEEGKASIIASRIISNLMVA